MKKPYNTIKEDQLFAHEKLIVSANGTQLKGIIPEQDTKVFYLKGLNGLRALAAIFVLIYHISAAYKIGQLYKLGESSVTIFFTLSGFLITFLLLKEIEKTNTIKVKKFYIRRILRIWPLYFLYLSIVLCVNFFIFSSSDNFHQILYYVLFIPNIPINLFKGGIYMTTHYWSLGVEEQFYFFWPIILKKFANRILYFFLAFIGLFLTMKLFVHLWYGGSSVLYGIFYYNRFDCMAIGGLGAYLYYKKFPILSVLNHLFFQLIAWLVLVLLFFNAFLIFGIISHDVIALITLILITNQISNPKTIIKLENRVFDYLGKISFGIYIYHPFIIALIVYGFKYFNVSIYGLGYLIVPLLMVIMTILISHLSYHLFESKFLQFKQKFAIVKSANSSKEKLAINRNSK